MDSERKGGGRVALGMAKCRMTTWEVREGNYCSPWLTSGSGAKFPTYTIYCNA